MASQPPFPLLADPLGAEQRTARPLLDFDVGGAFHYLTYDEGLSTPDATKAIAEKLAQEAQFDAAAAFKEGFTSEQIISKLTGIEKAPLETFAREAGRAGIEGVALSTAIKYGGPSLRWIGKQGAKLPGPYGKGAAMVLGGAGLWLGTLEAGKVAADQLIEEKGVLPSDLRYKVAGQTAGLFAGLAPGARKLLSKIPDVAKSAARTSPWWASQTSQKLLPKLSPEGTAEATRQVNLGAQKVLANAGKMRRRAEAAKQVAIEEGETIVYNAATKYRLGQLHGARLGQARQERALGPLAHKLLVEHYRLVNISQLAQAS